MSYDTPDSSRARSPSSTASQYQNHTNNHIPRTPSPFCSRDRSFGPLSLTTALDHVGLNDEDDSDLDTSLPFPAPLPRSDFLRPGPFDPSTYLSSAVSNRYQSLEDLRTELRTRVHSLNTELVELVNAQQEEFVGLGSSLHGGEERIEELRVGVLGLLREIGDIRGAVEVKEELVAAHLEERRRCRTDMEVGWACLELEERLGLLETRLGLRAGGRAPTGREGKDDSEQDDDEDDDEYDDDDHTSKASASLWRLERRVQDFQAVEQRWRRAGPGQAFVHAQSRRVEKCRDLLLVELGNCIKSLKMMHPAVDADRKMLALRLVQDLRSSKQTAAVQALRVYST